MTKPEKKEIAPVQETKEIINPEDATPDVEPKDDRKDIAAVVYGDVKKSTRFFFYLFTFFCVSFGLWAYAFELDVSSMTEGEVVPLSKVKVLQHLEGGIVKHILVKEGQLVEKDQPLVELEMTASDADVRELKLRISALGIEILRLETEIAGSRKIPFCEDLLTDQPRLVQEAIDLFNARWQSLENDLNRQEELVVERRQEINEITVRLQNQKQRLELLKEQIKISEGLLEDDLTNRYQHLNLLKENNSLKSAIEENSALLHKAEAALKGSEVSLEGIHKSFEADTQADLENRRGRYRELTERLRKFEDNLKRTILRAPEDGVIKNLYISTEGGVVRPGETLLDIVPLDDTLVIEAKLPTQDIGYIHKGQKAVIKLTSADARRFGNINGEVVDISPDTLINPNGNPYYKVRIAPENIFFEYRNNRYDLYPGMILSVSIHTGQRTVLEYLVSPWVSSMDSAMTER